MVQLLTKWNCEHFVNFPNWFFSIWRHNYDVKCTFRVPTYTPLCSYWSFTTFFSLTAIWFTSWTHLLCPALYDSFPSIFALSRQPSPKYLGFFQISVLFCGLPFNCSPSPPNQCCVAFNLFNSDHRTFSKQLGILIFFIVRLQHWFRGEVVKKGQFY